MGNAVAVSRRLFWLVAGVLAALLVGVAVLLVVIVGQNNAAAEQAEHSRFVEICESQVSDPYGDGFNAMIECVNALKR